MKFVCSVCGVEVKVSRIVLSIARDFPDRLQFWVDSECVNNNEHYRIGRDKHLRGIPLETKQKILDLFHGGKNIGEVKEIVGLDTLDVAEILRENLEPAYMVLRKEAKE
jgi:hypothetical protein